ncbi:helix-turn-helix domain-containing protein [Chromobacterium vaccinii]|nr:helix-turn-helix domain-containing protein [Chromobacterium vaccinii]
MMVLIWVPVNIFGIQMSEVGDRLREERERLGFNQTAYGAIGGVQKQAQLKYEKGERFPDAAYLESVAKVGTDIQFVITGTRSAQALSNDEQELLSLFRAASLEVKATIVAGLKGGNQPTSGSKISVGGSFHGQVVEGDVTNTVTGGMHIGGKNGEK